MKIRKPKSLRWTTGLYWKSRIETLHFYKHGSLSISSLFNDEVEIVFDKNEAKKLHDWLSRFLKWSNK